MKSLVKIAVAYAEHGYSVLPLNEDKKPLIKFADKPPLSVDEVKEVWKKYPFARLGIRTTDFFVIDADVNHAKGVNGVENLKEYINNHKRNFKAKDGRWITENTLAQRTAGGGLQIFFKKPLAKDKEGNETRNTFISRVPTVQQNVGWLPGVDIKAHHNNYVMVPPSNRYQRDEDGNIMQDENGKGLTKAYEWISETMDMLEAPSGLIKLINKNKMIKLNNKGNRFGVSKTSNMKKIKDMKIQKAIKLFEIIADGLGDHGERNDNLSKFVGGLLYLGVDPEITEKLSFIANANSPEPMSDQETEKTFISILKAELRQQGTEESN